MIKTAVTVRLMEDRDFDAVVAIDAAVLNQLRPEYYEQKFERLFRSGEYLPTSLVAEQDGRVIGFIMGELYIGEYGISREGATIDTVGVMPDCRRQGIGEMLMAEFTDHLRQLGVTHINTLVETQDSGMMHYFQSNGFLPSKAVINLVREI